MFLLLLDLLDVHHQAFLFYVKKENQYFQLVSSSKVSYLIQKLKG